MYLRFRYAKFLYLFRARQKNHIILITSYCEKQKSINVVLFGK